MHIYLDYASATPTDPSVVDAMLPYFTERFGNPSSIHAKGQEATLAIEHAIATIKRILHAPAHDIIFTSGGTESINLALLGIMRKHPHAHLITTAIEHKGILQTCAQLEREGHTITYLPVDKNGHVSAEHVSAAIQDNTALITIGYLNNEIGTIQDLGAISTIARQHNIPLHTDASQCAHLLNINTLGADLVTLNGSKLYGPKGIGLLLCRREYKPLPLVYGGTQQDGTRAGTQNVPGIIGIAKAVELLTPYDAHRYDQLYETFARHLTAPNCTVRTAHHIISLTAQGIEAEPLVKHASAHGLYISTGSACTSGDLRPSHVLSAIGMNQQDALSTVRISMGRDTTRADMQHAARILSTLIEQLRKANPREPAKLSTA